MKKKVNSTQTTYRGFKVDKRSKIALCISNLKEDKFIRCGNFNTCPTCLKHEAKKNKKVYCKDCKYSLEGLAWQFVSFCHHPLNLKNCDTYYEKIIKSDKTPSELNKNNRCSWYERKWYKFWV